MYPWKVKWYFWKWEVSDTDLIILALKEVAAVIKLTEALMSLPTSLFYITSVLVKQIFEIIAKEGRGLISL